MSERVLAHEMIDVAALYALGVLTQHEARAFEEHLGERCEACEAELKSFEGTVGALAYAAPEEAPPVSLRAQLLNRLNGAGSKQTEEPATVVSKEFESVLATEGEWQELQAGVMLKRLYVDPATGIATSLVKMLAGTALPPHQHIGTEQFFVIEGDCNVRGQRLGPGDYHRADAGTLHETTYTVNGTLLLLVAPESYQVLEAR